MKMNAHKYSDRDTFWEWYIALLPSQRLFQTSIESSWNYGGEEGWVPKSNDVLSDIKKYDIQLRQLFPQ